jgi:hypothetical protein
LYDICIIESSQLLSWTHSCLLKFQHLLTCLFLFIITDYDVRFIVSNGTVGFHLLVPWYSYFTFMT